MNNMTLSKRIAYALTPLAVLLLIDMVPVSKAAIIIPDNTATVAVADTTPPSDVSNVQAVAGDGSVSLSWNVATDNVGVTGYKVYYGTQSVTQDGGNYQTGPIDVGNKINYTVANLTNGTKYYFAVTAYDAAGNESSDYSIEVSATPLHGAPAEAPQVTKAQALDNTHVEVVFNEPVQIPATNPQEAFTIKNDSSGVQLNVANATIDAADPSGKSVLLQTDAQQPGASYILTAGIDVKNLSGTPIVSGTSDTAAFTGTDIVPSTQQAAQPVTQQSTQQASQGPTLTSVQALDGTHVQIQFNEPVVLKSDKLENFIITEAKNIENTLNIQSVDQSSDGTSATLTTDPMQNIQYNLIAVDVTDTQGNAISAANNATVFTGVAAPGSSTQQAMQGTQQVSSTQQVLPTAPPQDVTNFVASMIKQLIVTLSWTKSLNSSSDLAKYVLYMSTDGTNFAPGIDINPTASNFDVTHIVPGVKYFFKLVAMDSAGNASPGVMTTFILPKTGPELGFVLLGSLGAGKLLKRKKKAKKNK